MISIALIEANRLIRQGIAALLNQHPDLEVVAGASGAATSELKKAKPQVVLLDLRLGHKDSLRIAEQVKKEFPDSKVIVMDLLPVHEDIVEFVHVGVSGFVMKEATPDDLVNTIRSVANGAHVLPPQMTGTLFSQIAKHAAAKGPAETLDTVLMTRREREVIHLIAQGFGNKEIATRLNVATHTVKSHVRNIMEKLTLHTRLQIAAYASQRRASADVHPNAAAPTGDPAERLHGVVQLVR